MCLYRVVRPVCIELFGLFLRVVRSVCIELLVCFLELLGLFA